MKKFLLILGALLCLPLSLHAQVTASGSFSIDTVGTQAAITTAAGYGIAGSATASTTGTLSCGTYPTLSFFVTRNAQNYDLADLTTSSGTTWSGALKFTQLLPGDVVYAQITQSGISCTNEFPLAVTLSYMPSGGICYANPSACVNLTGTLAASNGISSNNFTVSFAPSQIFYVTGAPAGTPGGGPPANGGAGTIINSTVNCATSNDGSVVGVGNPLSQPVTNSQLSGTLPAGTYYVQYAFYDFTGHNTLVSPEIAQQLTGTGQITVAPPTSGIPAGVQGMSIYIGTTSGAETLQGTTLNNASFVQSTALVSGAAEPVSNSTACKIVANDAGWPTGTGYNVNLQDASGNSLPGYPMQWQLLGPGTTINLSNGLPYYHGTVIFPSPIIATPLNGATQSIKGSLNVTGNESVGGNLSVGGTFTAASVNGDINAADYLTYGDIGQAVNYIVSQSSKCVNGCSILVPFGTYPYTHGIVLATGVTLHGYGSCGLNTAGCGTTLDYSNGTGIAIDTNNCAGCRVTNFKLNIGGISSAVQRGIKWWGGYEGRYVDHLYITGGGPSTISFESTGDSVNFKNSGTGYVQDVRIDQYINIGIMEHHDIGSFFTNIQDYVRFDSGENLTAQGVVVDAGSSGANFNNVVTGGGLHGWVFRYTETTSEPNDYDLFPNYWKCQTCVGDSTNGGDAWLFDASLGTRPVNATMIATWGGGAGRDPFTLACVAPHAAGIHISGGSGLIFSAGQDIRTNCGPGMIIDGTAQNITVNGLHFDSNNDENDTSTLYESAINITNGNPGIHIGDGMCSDIIDTNGNQAYCVAFTGSGGFSNDWVHHMEATGNVCSAGYGRIATTSLNAGGTGYQVGDTGTINLPSTGITGSILNTPGTAYNVGDILSVQSGTGSGALIRITAVGNGESGPYQQGGTGPGPVVAYTLLTPGSGYGIATGATTTPVTGTGSGMTLNILSVGVGLPPVVAGAYTVNTIGAGGAVLTYTVNPGGAGYVVANGLATTDNGNQPGSGTGFLVNVLTLNNPPNWCPTNNSVLFQGTGQLPDVQEVNDRSVGSQANNIDFLYPVSFGNSQSTVGINGNGSFVISPSPPYYAQTFDPPTDQWNWVVPNGMGSSQTAVKIDKNGLFGTVLGAYMLGGVTIDNLTVTGTCTGCGGSGGGSTVNVNGSVVTNPNFNATTPPAASGFENVFPQVLSSDVSMEIPLPQVNTVALTARPNFNGSTPAAGAGYTNILWQGSGGNVSAEYLTPLSSLQFQNNGANFGGANTGPLTLNCVGCSFSGSSPTFTITASGGSGPNPGGQYFFPNYVAPGTGTTLGPSNIATDATFNNLYVPAGVYVGNSSTGPYCVSTTTGMGCYTTPGTLAPASFTGGATASALAGSGNAGWSLNASLLPHWSLNSADQGAGSKYVTSIGGSANAITGTLGGITAYDPAASYCFAPTSTNTSTTVTLNIDSLGALSVLGPAGIPLTTGEIVAGHYKCFNMNTGGTQFEDAGGSGGLASKTGLTGGPYTVATLPTGLAAGVLANVSDGTSGTDCVTGGGSTLVLCQYSGAAWSALVGSGSGDTITSPNSTLQVGGSTSATTLDLKGAVGKMMSGSTPALTYTPALGVDNSSAGTVQLSNGSANAHTILGSAATTSNTVLFPATAVTTGDLIKGVTSSTTTTLTDTGILATNVVTLAGSQTVTNKILGTASTSSAPALTDVGTSTNPTPSSAIISGLDWDSTNLFWKLATGFQDNASTPNYLGASLRTSQDDDALNLWQFQYLPTKLAAIEAGVSGTYATILLQGDSELSGFGAGQKSFVYPMVSALQSSANGWGNAGEGWVTSQAVGSGKNALPAGVVGGVNVGNSWAQCSCSSGSCSGTHSGYANSCMGLDNTDETSSASGDYQSYTGIFTDCYVYWLKQPSGGTATTLIDGSSVASGSTSVGSGYAILSQHCTSGTPLTEASHVLKAQVGSSATTTFLGAILIDTTVGHGVLVLKAGAAGNRAQDFVGNPEMETLIAQIQSDLTASGVFGTGNGIAAYGVGFNDNEWAQNNTTASVVANEATMIGNVTTAISSPAPDIFVFSDPDYGGSGSNTQCGGNPCSLWQYNDATYAFANKNRYPFISMLQHTYPEATNSNTTRGCYAPDNEHLATACQQQMATLFLDKMTPSGRLNTTAMGPSGSPFNRTNSQTSSYTIVATGGTYGTGDFGCGSSVASTGVVSALVSNPSALVKWGSAGSGTFTLPASGSTPPAFCYLYVYNAALGTLTLSPGSGTSLLPSTSNTFAEYEGALVWWDGTAYRFAPWRFSTGAGTVTSVTGTAPLAFATSTTTPVGTINNVAGSAITGIPDVQNEPSATYTATGSTGALGSPLTLISSVPATGWYDIDVYADQTVVGSGCGASTALALTGQLSFTTGDSSTAVSGINNVQFTNFGSTTAAVSITLACNSCSTTSLGNGTVNSALPRAIYAKSGTSVSMVVNEQTATGGLGCSVWPAVKVRGSAVAK